MLDIFLGSCEYDYVEIRDGGTDQSALIGRYCNSLAPSSQQSTGNVMYVRFRSDRSVTRRGFKLKYRIGTSAF